MSDAILKFFFNYAEPVSTKHLLTKKRKQIKLHTPTGPASSFEDDISPQLHIFTRKHAVLAGSRNYFVVVAIGNNAYSNPARLKIIVHVVDILSTAVDNVKCLGERVNGGTKVPYCSLQKQVKHALSSLCSRILGKKDRMIDSTDILILLIQATIEGYRNVWYVTMAILFTETTFYLIFASGKEQSWNTLLVDKEDEDARSDSPRPPRPEGTEKISQVPVLEKDG